MREFGSSFSKKLSTNDTPDRTGHQSALVILKPDGARLFPDAAPDHPVEINVRDRADGTISAHAVRLFAKGEYHLTLTDPLLAKHALHKGSTVHFELAADGMWDFTFEVDHVGTVTRLQIAIDDAPAGSEEVESFSRDVEGRSALVTSTRYERSAANREACLVAKGTDCSVCGFDFAAEYGEIGAGFIHVHHVEQLSGMTEAREIDPAVDLEPVCPNCHAMLHRRRGNDPLTVAQLKAFREVARAR